MLSYMLPVEEKTSTTRNLNLSLNLQNTTSTSHNSSDTDEHNQHDDLIDENTKLLSSERDYSTTSAKTNGNVMKNGGNNIIYNNLTNNNLNNINNNNYNTVNSNSIIKNGGSTITKDDDSTTTTSINNNDETNSNAGDKKTIKMTKIGSKNVTLKRVSFGSSKGSMVETLVFETPTPLPEHAEREFFSPANTTSTNITNNVNGLNDSGIELQEEVERSKVRVSFFQSSKPQSISPPSYASENQLIYFGDNYNSYNNNNSLIDSFLQNSSVVSDTDSSKMTAVATLPPSYDREISAESGWDNPFRPGGDLSREADEIVNLIKGGKPITPTGDQHFLNGSVKDSQVTENGTTVVDGATKVDASPLQTAQNGTKSPQKTQTNGDVTQTAENPQTEVSNQVIEGPQQASHVVIDEKKKKNCRCCVIQ